MDDLKSIFDLIQSIGGPKVECEALEEWHAAERRAREQRAGRIAATVFLVAGVAIVPFSAGFALLAKSPLIGTPWVLSAVLLAVASVLVSYFWTVRRCAKWIGPKRYRDPELAEVMERILDFPNMKRLRRDIGDNGIAELNEGAIQLLRCRSALTAEAWTSLNPGDPWFDARNEMIRSMDAAMGRLVIFVTNRRPFSEISSVLEQMRAAANEAVRVTEVRSHSAGSAGRDLRASIARMRELTVAEDELLHIREL